MSCMGKETRIKQNKKPPPPAYWMVGLLVGESCNAMKIYSSLLNHFLSFPQLNKR